VTRVQRAPAKINLGLEILGRRDDGYHEVRTILCAISLADRLTFEEAGDDEIVLQHGDIDVPAGENLVTRALDAMRQRGAAIPPQRVTVDKRIPAAAGLGGASSDAAATLRAFTPELTTAGADPVAIAASLGSDVPFFLGGPIGLASGRGEILAHLPTPHPAWIVLVTPALDIPDKTRTMYRAVDPAWWSDGSRVDALVRALPNLPNVAPVNVFERALLTRFPVAEAARQQLLAAGAPFAALTGAGPTFYTLVDTEARAREIAARVEGSALMVNVARLGEQDDA
jgi:4-diphosphocytidyl-2-C-methyl-D-erythritol kinase